MGASFHNLITDESQFLANKINQTELQTVEERFADFEITHGLPRHHGTSLERSSMSSSLFCSRRPRPSRLSSSLSDSSPLRCACSWDRYSYRSSSFRNWSGSFGAGSNASSNMLSTRSSQRRSSISLRTSSLGIFDLQPTGTISTVQLIELVSGPLHYFSRFDLYASENPGAYQPHL